MLHTPVGCHSCLPTHAKRERVPILHTQGHLVHAAMQPATSETTLVVVICVRRSCCAWNSRHGNQAECPYFGEYSLGARRPKAITPNTISQSRHVTAGPTDRLTARPSDGEPGRPPDHQDAGPPDGPTDRLRTRGSDRPPRHATHTHTCKCCGCKKVDLPARMPIIHKNL